MVSSGQPHLLLDVREEVEYDICHLSHSRSILPLHTPYTPYSIPRLDSTPDIPLKKLQKGSLELAWQWIQETTPSDNDYCRL